MKKLLSLVLALSMILGSFGMAFAATPSDVVGESCSEAVNVLTELGVVEGYKDGTFRPENVVTRAEMATLIIKALGLNDYAVGKSNFSDMSGHWADPYVAYAASLGFISGYTDGTFRPNTTVSYDQAITMVVQALGYKGEYLTGGYPGAFVTQAKTLGLLDDIKSGSAGANRGDVAILLYNTLPVSFVRYDNDGALQKITVDSDDAYDTMLRRLGAYADDDAFVIEGDEDSLINLQEYIGAYVTVYREDDADGDILAINEVKSVFLKGEFEKDNDIADLVSGSEEFTTLDDVTYTIKSDAFKDIGGVAKVVTFKNGATKDLTEVEDGNDSYVLAAKVSGKKITDIYSISVWEVSERAMVDDEDLMDIDDDHELLGVDFEEDDDEEIDLTKFALLGVDSLDDIKEDHIVYVYKDDTDGYVKRIEVGTKVVTGTITKMNSDGDTITVGGTKYEAYDGGVLDGTDAANASAVEIDGAAKVATGDEVKLYLDYDGDIYYIEIVDNDADLMGIVIETGVYKSGLNGDDGKIKLFLADGTTKTFTIDDDDLEGDDFNAMITNGDLAKGAIVKYGLNSDGLMDALEVADKGDRMTGSGDISDKGNFEGYRLSKNVVVFTAENVDLTKEIVDTTRNSDWDDELGVSKYSSLLGKEDVNAIYYYDSSSNEIEWIVIDGGTTSDGIFAVYQGYSAIDGDTDYEIDLMIDGKNVSYGSDDKGSKLADEGQFVLYEVTFNSSDEVDKLKKVTSDLDEDYFVTSAAVSKDTTIKNNVVKTTDGKVYTLDSDVIVYTWDDDDEEWTKGSTSDIRKGDDYTKVVFYDVVDTDKVYDIVLVW